MNNQNFKFSKSAHKNFYLITIVIFTIVLIYRLFYLQILHQTDYRLQSDQNRIKEVTLQPLRGLIFDRNGTLLVNNSPAFSLYALPYFLHKNPTQYNRLAKFIHRDVSDLKKTVRRDMRGYFKPVRLMRQVNFPVVSRIEELRMNFPGIGFWIEPIRAYPSSVNAAHVLGYLGEISTDELETDRNTNYLPGDVIGKKGIEKTYENLLHGKPGVRYVEVDVLGRDVKTLDNPKQQDPVPGDNLYLTLDYELQLQAEKLMETSLGSIIMMDLNDGGILTMVSKPDYAPGSLSGIITPAVWKSLQQDTDHPLYDRSIQSVFPPGSTFKLVLAIAALATHTIDPEYTFNCPGYFRLGRRAFKCWWLKGHGRLNLYQAIEQSCNVYFYQLGLKVGLDNWSKYAKILQFGKKTGIDLPLENSGIVPNKQFLDQRYGEGKWTNGLLLNLSVGQGDLLVTPLQMLQLAAIIAKGGRFYKPHLYYYSNNPVTGKESYFQPDSVLISTIPDTVFSIVREGMRMVVQGTKGTGHAAYVPNIEVAGKTGTAQNPHGEPHAWFIGFAPLENPQVAIVVFIENGGSGGSIAAPKAGSLLRSYFKKKQEKEAQQILAHKQ